jgi:hypothetical protein
VFDTNGDPIGVNNGLLAVCDPALQNPDAAKQFECKQGTGLLQGTGFARGEYTERGLLGESQGGGGLHGLADHAGARGRRQHHHAALRVWDTGDTDMGLHCLDRPLRLVGAPADHREHDAPPELL